MQPFLNPKTGIPLLLLLFGMFNPSHAQTTRISVQLKVPDGGWSVRIAKVYQSPGHLIAVSELKRQSGPAIQVIREVKDSVKVRAAKLPVKHYVLGKTWSWQNIEPYVFVSGQKELAKHIAGARLVYEAKQSDKVAGKSRYIVVYKKEIFTNGKTKQGETLQQLAKRHCKELGGSSPRVLGIINGFAAEFPSDKLPKLKGLSEVKYVEIDRWWVEGHISLNLKEMKAPLLE